MNRKIVFAVACIVAALVAYVLFINYSYSQYEEYDAIQRAEWIARGWSAELYDGYAREGIFATVYGSNVTNFGLSARLLLWSMGFLFVEYEVLFL